VSDFPWGDIILAVAAAALGWLTRHFAPKKP
jgi:hypothetical protein